MKNKFYSLVILLTSSFIALSQGVGINSNGASPHPAAGLDVNFDNKGFLPPRLTTAQRDAILNPPNGLVIYNTTTNCLNFFIGIGWNESCGSASSYGVIGDLLCGTAQHSGSLKELDPATNVSSQVFYTGGNGGPHTGQVVQSTAILGLTATIAAGNFANGAGSLIVTITGTPSTAGEAYFALNIGGKSCTLIREVNVADLANSCNPNNPTPVIDVINPMTGKKWMDRNLGASQLPTTMNTNQGWGYLWQWGRASDGHQCINRFGGAGEYTSSVLNNGFSGTATPGHGQFIQHNSGYWTFSNIQESLWQAGSQTNNPCPQGYRVPKLVEWNEEIATWSSSTNAGAFASPLKLTPAGVRQATGSISPSNGTGYYWSSTIGDGSPFNASAPQAVTFGSGVAINSTTSGNGLSVRCIKEYAPQVGTLGCNEAVINGSLIAGSTATAASITIPYTQGNLANYGQMQIPSTGVLGLTATLSQGALSTSGELVFVISGTPAFGGQANFEVNFGGHSCNFSLVVYTSVHPNNCNINNPTPIVEVTNPVTGRIWMDRNLGASRVAISASDAQAYGSLFQWGRGADGHQCVNRFAGDGVTTSTETTTASSTSTPGHGQFIYSTNFWQIWDFSFNNDLWQPGSQTNNPCPEGFRVPTMSEWYDETQTWSQAPINSTPGIAGGFASPLKLSTNGSRGNQGNLIPDGFGHYWTSTINGTSAYEYNIQSGSSIPASRTRANAQGVRCIKN